MSSTRRRNVCVKSVLACPAIATAVRSDRALHRSVDIGIGKTQNCGAYATVAHVEIGFAVEINDFGPLGRLEIGRPLLGQEHFRTLRERLRPAGHDLACTPIECLAQCLASPSPTA